MKNEKKVRKSKRTVSKPKRDISDLIDEMAYLEENKNIQKSKSFLDNMYLLNQQ